MPPVPPGSLRTLVAALLVAGGADERDAATVADVLTWADERQRYPQGAVWVDNLLDRLASGALRSPSLLAVDEAAPAVVRIDAGGGFGHVAATAAASAAADRAERFGLGAAVVVGSHHFGAAGHYASQLADHGLVGIAMTNVYPKVAAHGGGRPALGTNPLAFSAPAGSARIVADLSTGALAGSRVREAVERGERLEPGMAIDREGRPTIDPAAMEAGGTMLPAAGPKGYALGLMVEILTAGLGGGALAAEVGSMFDLARPAGVSHVVLAVRPLDEGFAGRVERLLAEVTGADGPGSAVRVPGGEGGRLAAEAAHDGISLPAATVARLRIRAEELGVEAPSEWS